MSAAEGRAQSLVAELSTSAFTELQLQNCFYSLQLQLRITVTELQLQLQNCNYRITIAITEKFIAIIFSTCCC